MSHHFDSPIAREDVRLDITDLYVFRGETGTVFVINVCHSIANPPRLATIPKGCMSSRSTSMGTLPRNSPTASLSTSAIRQVINASCYARLPARLGGHNKAEGHRPRRPSLISQFGSGEGVEISDVRFTRGSGSFASLSLNLVMSEIDGEAVR